MSRSNTSLLSMSSSPLTSPALSWSKKDLALGLKFMLRSAQFLAQVPTRLDTDFTGVWVLSFHERSE